MNLIWPIYYPQQATQIMHEYYTQNIHKRKLHVVQFEQLRGVFIFNGIIPLIISFLFYFFKVNTLYLSATCVNVLQI